MKCPYLVLEIMIMSYTYIMNSPIQGGLSFLVRVEHHRPQVYPWEPLYPHNDPPRPSRLEAGLFLVIMMEILRPVWGRLWGEQSCSGSKQLSPKTIIRIIVNMALNILNKPFIRDTHNILLSIHPKNNNNRFSPSVLGEKYWEIYLEQRGISFFYNLWRTKKSFILDPAVYIAVPRLSDDRIQRANGKYTKIIELGN